MSEALDIGDVTAASGLPASTLHVWERRGLLEPAGRVGRRRQYDANVLDRIAIIVTLQGSGFTLGEIVELLAAGAFDDDKQVLHEKLEVLVEQRRILDRAIDGIQHAIACPGPSPLDCDGFRQHLEGALPVAKRPKLSGPNR